MATAGLAYGPALWSPFLFDDQPAVVDNSSIRSLTPLSTVLVPPRDTPVAGRPIVNLSFALNYAANGIDPFGYRLVNLLLHVTAGLLLFVTVRRVLLLPRLHPRFGAHALDLAFACALLWTLHPIQSEVVNYVTERTESVMGVFYLLTIYASVRAAATPGPWSVVAVIACAAGMLSKESMVTVPVAVLLIDRVLIYGSWRSLARARRALYAGFGASWMLLAAIMATGQRSSVGFEAGTGAWVYLLNQAQMVTRYLWLAFWPRALVLDYGLPQPLTLSDVWPQALLVSVLVIAAVIALVRRPLVGLPAAWFFLTLAPTSSFVPISTEVGAERRMYLPLIGIIVLLVLGVFSLVRSRDRATQRVAASALAILAALLMAGTVVRGREYSSPLTMAQSIVDRWPNGRGRFLLGTLLLEAGQREEGMRQLQQSAPDYPGALFAIATEQLAAGQTSEGIATISQFIDALPGHVNVIPARDMRARALAATGDLGGAEAEARQLVMLAPRYAPGHDLLGRLLAQRGDFRGAAEAFGQVLALQPANAEARQNLTLMQRLMAGDR